MTVKLQFSDYNKINHLIDDIQCERALIHTVLSRSIKGEIFADNIEDPNVAILIYNNEAIIVGNQKKKII